MLEKISIHKWENHIRKAAVFWSVIFQSAKCQDVQFKNRSVPSTQWNIYQPSLNCWSFNALLPNLNCFGDLWNNWPHGNLLLHISLNCREKPQIVLHLNVLQLNFYLLVWIVLIFNIADGLQYNDCIPRQLWCPDKWFLTRDIETLPLHGRRVLVLKGSLHADWQYSFVQKHKETWRGYHVVLQWSGTSHLDLK